MASTQDVIVVTPAASSNPISGTLTASNTSAVFTPQLGRDMYLTLSGTWTGTVQLQRSTDGGQNWNNITMGGGQAWGRYTGNCDEVVDTPTDAASTYRLSITLSGTSTLRYRLSQ